MENLTIGQSLDNNNDSYFTTISQNFGNVLISGDTGSGKSIFADNLIKEILRFNTNKKETHIIKINFADTNYLQQDHFEKICEKLKNDIITKNTNDEYILMLDELLSLNFDILDELSNSSLDKTKLKNQKIIEDLEYIIKHNKNENFHLIVITMRNIGQIRRITEMIQNKINFRSNFAKSEYAYLSESKVNFNDYSKFDFFTNINGKIEHVQSQLI